MASLVLLMCSLVFIVSLTGTLIRSRLKGRIDLVDWFVVTIGGYAGVIVFFIVWRLDGLGGISHNFFVKSDILFLFPGLSILAILMVWAGASLVKGNNKSFEDVNDDNHIYKAVRLPIKVVGVAWFFLVMAIGLYWVYARPFGGFNNLLSYTSMIRAGLLAESGLDTSYSFLKRFGGFAFFSTVLFGGYILTYPKLFKASFHLWIGLLLSFSFSLYVLYSWGGRLAILVFLGILPLSFYFKTKGFGYKTFFRMLFFVLFASIVLPASSGLWGKTKEVRPLGEFVVKELSFPLNSFVKGYEYNDYRMMKDLVFIPVFFLPKRIWSGYLEIKTVSAINTARVVGYEKGVYGNTGTVPVDFINFGMIEGGSLGVLFTAFIFGIFLAKLDKWILYAWQPGFREVIYGYTVMNIVVITVIYSDPQHIMIRNFPFIVGIFFIKLFLSKRNRIFFLKQK